MIEEGSLIDGRYEVEALIGEGGLAHVYKVRHKALGSVHALKLLSWRKKQLAERLLTEGRIQAQLQHPNIVSVIDLVQHEGQFGLLMEYVDNQCLEDFIVENGGLGVDGGLELFAPILSAVAAAHDAGVTHRDLKPANVLLARGPGGVVPKVTDFGIAKVMAELTGTSTAAGSTMGTPGYLAPEQIEDSSNVDKRADIFALGAILYELITGRQAFIEDDGTIGVMSTSRVTPPPLDTWLAEVPDHLDVVLARAMAKNPVDRYGSCIELARALYVDRPRLESIVTSVGTTTTTLSLAGAREEVERTLTRRETGRPAPTTSQPATLIAPPPLPSDEESGTSARVWVGVGLLAVGAVLITIALAGAGAFGVKRTMVGDPDVAPVQPTAPVAVPAPVEPAPVEPAAPSAPDQPPPAPPSGDEPAPVQPVVAEPVAPAPQPAVPDPAPVTDPVPAEPVVEPSPEPPPQPVEPEPVPSEPRPAAVAPTPPPEPAPVAPTPAPTLPDVAGSYAGKANRRPVRVRLEQSGAALTGRVLFPGATTREESLQGTVDAQGNVRFTAGDLDFRGTVSGGTLQGTYTSGGGKALDWSVAR